LIDTASIKAHTLNNYTLPMKRPGDYAKLTKISVALPLLESGAESSNADFFSAYGCAIR
jgi:hypothetical protein